MRKQQEQRGLKGFFMSMLPNFEKSRMLEALDGAFKEMRITRDMYAMDGAEYRGMMRNELSELDRQLRQHTDAYRGDLITLVHETLKARLEEESEFMTQVEEIYGPVVLRDSLDYQKIYTLRYIDGVMFMTDYARKLILLMVEDKIGDPDLASPISRADRDFVMNPKHMTMFSIMLNAMQVSAKDFRQVTSKLKGIQFKPETHDSLTRGDRGMDPLSTNMMPVVGNFVFMVGRMYNLYISSKLEQTKEQQEKLRIQLLLLRRREEDNADPEESAKLKKQIEYYNNRLNKISAKIEDITEDD